MTLKERLEQGQYHVDATQVAEAILRNPLWIMLLAGGVRRPAESRPAVG